MPKTPRIPDIPEQERTPVVAQSLEVIHYQAEIIQSLLRDENAILKGNKPKPMIKPSGMEDGDKKDGNKNPSEEKRPGSEKRNKTEGLKIHVNGSYPKGNNGFCTHMENDLFAWFESTESKQ